MKKRGIRIAGGLIFALLSAGFAQEKNRLSLEECVEIALKQNTDLIRGEFTMKMAGKDVTIAISNLLPRVSGNMGYYHSVVGPSIQRIDPGTGIPVPVQFDKTTAFGSYAGVSVNQSLLNGGTDIFSIIQSRNMKKSADYAFEDTRQATLYVVKERYYNLLAAEKLLEVAEETLKSSEESYKRSQVLFEVGKVPKSDVLKATVQLETGRSGLIEAQNGLAIARASLNHILGFDVDQEVLVVDNLNVPEMEVGYEDVMESALSSHPALKTSLYSEKAAKAGVGFYTTSFIPSLSLYFSYDWSHSDFSEIKDILNRNYRWSSGVNLTIPIFEGWSRMASWNKARLAYLSSKETLEQTRRDIALEAKQAFFEVQQSKRKIAVTQNQVDAAEEDLRLNKEKYSLGAGTMLELIDAQVSATTAKSDHIQSLYNYKFAIARLQKAMGKLEK